MIHTIYCNVYEGLEAALVENINQDLQNMVNDPSRIFEEIRIIPASKAIEDRLSRSLADKFSILPGVKLLSIFDWGKEYMGATFRPGSIGTSLDWQIWEILKNPQFFEKLKQSVPEESYKRLESFLHRNSDKGLRDINLIEFCYSLSTLFAAYGSYRMDWLLNWIDEKEFPLPADKTAVMKAQPDYHWQKYIWEQIARANKTQDLRNLRHIKETLRNFQFNSEEKEKSLHFFMPFSLPPILLPFLKAFAEDENAPDLWLYIMNPSAEYWFESVPLELFDWDLGRRKEGALKFLTTNSPSTRALIDRLYRFLNVDSAEILETDSIEEKLLPQPTKHSRNTGLALSDLKGKFDPLSPDQHLLPDENNEDVQAYYFEQRDDSYLHQFQNSILLLDPAKLPEEPDYSDESLKVFKAPSFPREIEGVIEWLHYRLTQSQKSASEEPYQLSDIAVIVPDIEKAAPAIEAVMGSLPKELRLPYKIIGNSIADTYLSLSAILGFGKLLNSRFNASDFEEWLELPINLERWNLSLSDISILSSWLKGAGFRFGLSQQHLKDLGLDESDGTLDLAIERLTMGYFINPIEKNTFGDILPTFGDEKGGFDLVTDSRGELFKTAAALAQSLEETRQELFKDGGLKTPQEWHELISSWLNQYFVTNSTPQEIQSFRNSLQRLAGAMGEGLDKDTKVPFSVIWNVIETHLKNTPNPSKSNGSITFSSVQELRGLPFKIIALCGFDETSGFPGNTSHQEFDLMGVDALKRRADRDSREDNKARFLDTLLAARRALVISYTVGADPSSKNNPSSVVQNFKNYFLSNALAQENGKEKAEKLWKSIEVDIPLNSFSEKNFILEKTNSSKGERTSKNWLSPNSYMLNAVLKAKAMKYAQSVSQIGGVSLPESSLSRSIFNKQSISVTELIRFFLDPDGYILKKHKLNDFEGAEESEFSWLAPDDGLSLSGRKRQYLTELEQSYSFEEIENQRLRNPINGIQDVRIQGTASSWIDVVTAFMLKQKVIEDEELVPLQNGITIDIGKKISGISQLTDSAEGMFTDADGTFVILDPCFSKAQSNRISLRAKICSASGRPTKVIKLTQAPTDEVVLTFFDEYIPTKEDNQKVLEYLLKIYALAKEYSLGLTKNKEGSLLWRGFDQERAYWPSLYIRKFLFPDLSGSGIPKKVDWNGFIQNVDELETFIKNLQARGNNE